MGKRDREIDAGAPETGRDCGTAGQSDMGDVNSERETQSQRETQRPGGAPTPPSSAPDTADKGSPFPPARLCQAQDNAPLSWLQSRQLEGRPGPGGRGSHQEAGLWPLPSDSLCSPWPPFQVSAYSQHVWSTCCVYLKCPLASPGTLSSPLSLPAPSACPSCASGFLPWRKWSLITFLVFAKQFPHTASAPQTVPSALTPFTSS